MCVWLVAVGVWSGWVPPSRGEQEGGRCVEQEPGKMCCGSGASCEWPGARRRLREQVPGRFEKGGRLKFFRPFLFSLRGWLVSVVCSDGCGAPEESKIGGLTGVAAF